MQYPADDKFPTFCIACGAPAGTTHAPSCATYDDDDAGYGRCIDCDARPGEKHLPNCADLNADRIAREDREDELARDFAREGGDQGIDGWWPR